MSELDAVWLRFLLPPSQKPTFDMRRPAAGYLVPMSDRFLTIGPLFVPCNRHPAGVYLFSPHFQPPQSDWQSAVLENQDVWSYYTRRAVVPLITRPRSDAQRYPSWPLQIAYFVK